LHSKSHIARLYFSSQKKASERLKLLFDAGYVGRFHKPLLDVRGKPEFVYCEKGKAVRGFSRVSHALAVTDFNVVFLSWLWSCRDFSGKFFYASQFPKGLFGGMLIPDGVFVLEKDRKKLLYFLEVDCGTESLTSNASYSFEDKLDVYADYFDSRDYKNDFGFWNYCFKGFRVAVVFCSENRLKNFLEIVKSKKADFVLCSAFKKVNESKFSDKVWNSFDGCLNSIAGKEVGI